MKIALLALALMAVSTTTFAKPAYKKALGATDCTVCHIKGEFAKPNMENKLYKTSKEYADKIKAGAEGFKDKTCNDCHKGKMVPVK